MLPEYLNIIDVELMDECGGLKVFKRTFHLCIKDRASFPSKRKMLASAVEFQATN